jgi:hypothetical protein
MLPCRAAHVLALALTLAFPTPLLLAFLPSLSVYVCAQFWGCSDVRISNTSKQGPHINASFSDLSDRLVAALADQERLEKQHGPARPLEQYWKAELLAAADKLDEMHHQHQHSRRTQHGVGLEGPQEGSVPASAQQQQQQGP